MSKGAAVQLPSAEQKIFFEAAAAQYQRDLAADRPAQEYLRGRGFGSEIAQQFRLGVLRNPLLGHEQFRGRLAIPYITPHGIVTFTFRCLQGHVCKDTVLYVNREGKEVRCKKYRAPEGMERTLYNVMDFKKPSDTIYVCEGEIDAMTLSMCGFPAVAMPGVSQWKKFFADCFTDYTTIFAVADGDSAGYRLSTLLATEIGARPVRPPKGEDVNSIYTKGGTHAVRQWLAGATQ